MLSSSRRRIRSVAAAVARGGSPLRAPGALGRLCAARGSGRRRALDPLLKVQFKRGPAGRLYRRHARLPRAGSGSRASSAKRAATARTTGAAAGPPPRRARRRARRRPLAHLRQMPSASVLAMLDLVRAHGGLRGGGGSRYASSTLARGRARSCWRPRSGRPPPAGAAAAADGAPRGRALRQCRGVELVPALHAEGGRAARRVARAPRGPARRRPESPSRAATCSRARPRRRGGGRGAGRGRGRGRGARARAARAGLASRVLDVPANVGDRRRARLRARARGSSRAQARPTRPTRARAAARAQDRARMSWASASVCIQQRVKGGERARSRRRPRKGAPGGDDIQNKERFVVGLARVGVVTSGI